MARKRSDPAEEKPASLPPKEEETSSEEEEGSGEDEEPRTQVIPKKLSHKKPESVEPKSKSKKPKSKPSAPVPAKSTAKRPSDCEQDQKSVKRPKKTDQDEIEEEGEKTGDDTKKQLFQRIWSEEDEINLLKGMLEYGVDACSDISGFLSFIKKSLHFDVSKSQLSTKMGRLKKKFNNNLKRAKKGRDPVFSRAHDQQSYELSKKIWGADGGTESAVKSEKKDEKETEVYKNEGPSRRVSSLLDKRYVVAKLEEQVLKRGLDMVQGEKKAEMEKKWKKLRIAEVELFLQRNDLLKEQALLMLDHKKKAKE